ncbi:unnamed protein product [Penicillium camemberti]|uniref:Str. FM013 n=1 Tax=Penicillium camemberti (strain FM 013) TaxID=1429867 RepID=A0A0G4PVM7_PENC3|nr:unnamed protein product [Penicillium camemberti]
MSPRSACGWPEWKEKNILPWLDAHRDLLWKACSEAYYGEYRVDRSVESLRGKKYHILLPQNMHWRQSFPKSRQTKASRCRTTLRAADPSQPVDNNEPTQTKRTNLDRVTPAPLPYTHTQFINARRLSQKGNYR